MIEDIKREDGPFVVLERKEEFNNFYLKCMNGEQVCCYIHFQLLNDIAYIHLYVVNFSAKILRVMRDDLEDLKKMLAKRGIGRIIGTHMLEGSEKWEKFLRLVGFPPVQGLDDYAKMTYMEI